MKCLMEIRMPILLLMLTTPFSVHAETITEQQALSVADNWIQTIISNMGHWGDSTEASVRNVQPIVEEGRLLGYFCKVHPHGYIYVSSMKVLVPVKAYSAEFDIDPGSDRGIAVLVRSSFRRTIRSIETRSGPIDKRSQAELQKVMSRNYTPAWEMLLKDNVLQSAQIQSEVTPLNYTPGDSWLLTSCWHQFEPYNAQCPSMGCSRTCGSNTNALVGCPSTAGSQIFRYWGWPPYGDGGSPYDDTYTWRNMPDSFSGCTWVTEQVDAVAELCHEVGIAFNMNYGCSASSGQLSFRDVLPHFRYKNTAELKVRSDFSPAEWDLILESDLKKNRPIYYAIPGHLIVIDGWKDVYPGPIRYYHINYGDGGDSGLAWYTIDDIPGGDPDDEACIVKVYPEVAIGTTLLDTYPRNAFPYWYLDQDVTGYFTTTFAAGNYVQFLHGIRLKSNGTVRFEGTAAMNSRLFTRGNHSIGIRILNGTIQLTSGGCMKFY